MQIGFIRLVIFKAKYEHWELFVGEEMTGEWYFGWLTSVVITSGVLQREW